MDNFIIESIAVGFIATIAMTAFSYSISYISKNIFEEPQLINMLLSQWNDNSFNLEREHIVGWAIHFLIGMFFVLGFKILHMCKILDISVLSGIIYGLFAGVIGVFFWGIVLWIHPNTPKINRTRYLLQLIPAHIVFGITMIYLL
ncbi:hypothetical protein ACWGOQ_0002615 [Aquimarina sp. M1]